MEQVANLTKVQQDLINGLVKEFTKINPKPTNGVARFSFETINDCLKEEERFLKTIAKHNQTMMKVFVDQLKSDIKGFEKEFGKVVGIEMGITYQNGNESNTLNSFLTYNTKQILSRNESSEIRMFFVSKVKRYRSSESRYDYFNGKLYHGGIYVDFKREKVTTKLDSGKEVYAYKIVGLQYNTNDWLYRDKEGNRSFSSLDEMVQTHKPIQQRIVELVQ